jgi:hypothetical protein
MEEPSVASVYSRITGSAVFFQSKSAANDEVSHGASLLHLQSKQSMSHHVLANSFFFEGEYKRPTH